MKTTILTAFILQFCMNGFAQDFAWVKTIGGNDFDQAEAITTDAAGNIYVTGGFMGTVDFDPGAGTFNLSAPSGDEDIFVCKLDTAGELLWAVQFSGEDYEHGYAIAVDDAGNVYTTGYFSQTTDFNPDAGTYNLTALESYDMFISKLDHAGHFVWAKQISGSEFDEIGLSIKTDGSGNVYTTGEFFGAVDFDPDEDEEYFLTSPVYDDIFVLKLDSAGNFVWAGQFSGPGFDVGLCLTLDDAGNSYVTGDFTETMDFDPGAGTFNLTSYGSADIFVAKLSTSGNFIWAKQMGGINGDIARGITLDPTGNILTTGTFSSPADFDPGAGVFNLVSPYYADMFICKLDTAGNLLWAKNSEGYSTDEGAAISTDETGNIYTAGIFSDTVDFDPDPSVEFSMISNGAKDVFIFKCDASGNFIWAKQIGGINNDFATDIWVDHNENVFTTGYFQETVDFNTETGIFTLEADGEDDIFIHKMAVPDTVVPVMLPENSMDQIYTLFPNPVSSSFVVSGPVCNEIASMNIRNALGQIIRSELLKSSAQYFTLPEPAGLYFIEIIVNDDSVQTFKILKQ